MKKTYRLEFISKRPAALRTAWQELLRNNALKSNLGVLTGRFEEDSPELRKVLACYERDKAALDVRMESSCVVAYDHSDIDSHRLFKLYPPDVKLTCTVERMTNYCDECGRNVGSDANGMLAFDDKAIIPCAVAMSTDGDLLIHRDLVDQIEARNDPSEYLFENVESTKLMNLWSVVKHAPIASRIGGRAGFCNACGGAMKCDCLPDVDETYLLESNQDFILSPDRPALPCFSKDLATWLIDTCTEITWEQFKPINIQVG